MSITYSKELAQAISSYLKKDDWKQVFFDEETGVFTFSLNLTGSLPYVTYIIDVSEDSFLVLVRSPIQPSRTDKKTFTTLAEFVCRANFGMKNGCFDFNLRDGELYFKSFVDCDGLIPSYEVIRNSIHCPAAMFELYSPGILAIVFGKMSAEKAVAQCQEDHLSALMSLSRDDTEESKMEFPDIRTNRPVTQAGA